MAFVLPPNRTYVIAEAGVNHDGDPAKARQLIDVAADAGADAVKFQLFDADEIAATDAPLAEYQKRSGEADQHAMLKRLMLKREDYVALKTYAESKKIDFITTPFDSSSARFLAELQVPAMKIASGELTNIPLLEDVAALKIFTILSTGMANMEEVRDAVEVFTHAGTPFALLHCVSAYPAPITQINLRAMESLKEFNVPVGYSDHTEGIGVAVTAAKRGARILEKHFTLRKTDPGPDHAASLEPDELTEMMRILRDEVALQNFPLVKEALGTPDKHCQPCEENTRAVARRSLILSRPAKKGDTLKKDMITIRRPGTGLPPKALRSVLGRKAAKALDAGTPLTEDSLL